MTTTLRPLEPERREPGGRRERRYAVCVNSRRVGEILVGARPLAGELVGEVSGLVIGEGDRRRGRGTVAALAAEEVLRQWRCKSVEAAVPGDSEAGERLATALGYTERNRQLAKRLSETPPPLPEDCSARTMTGAEFASWLEHERAGRVRVWTAAGLTRAEAQAKADADCRAHLPDGVSTAGAVLRVLACGGRVVGTLWAGLSGPAGPGRAWVFAVEVAGDRRGRGHGRTLMLLAEAECVAAGVRELGLDVPVANVPALRLYESLGYRVVGRSFAKPLL